MTIIDCKAHSKESEKELEMRYNLKAPIERRREHHCVKMYRLSKIHGNLDIFRPTVNLRSRNKVKFRQQRQRRNLMNIGKSQMLRGVKLWNEIPQAIQHALTKVKFKIGIKTVRLTTV